MTKSVKSERSVHADLASGALAAWKPPEEFRYATDMLMLSGVSEGQLRSSKHRCGKFPRLLVDRQTGERVAACLDCDVRISDQELFG